MNVKTACQGTAVKSFLHLDTTLTRIIFFYSYIYFLKASVKRTLRKMEHKIANLHKTTLSLAIMPQSATHMNYLQMWTAHCCLIYHQYILAYSSLYIFLHSVFFYLYSVIGDDAAVAIASCLTYSTTTAILFL